MKRHTIVFVTYGSLGDINPLLAIAQRLAKTAPVRFISNETYREHVEGAGVRFFAAGTSAEQAACTETAALSGRSLQGLINQFRHHVGKNIARVAALLESWSCDGDALIVVTHGTINAAFPICEKLGIPVVRAHYAPSHIPLQREDFILEQMFYGCRRWRARWLRYPSHAVGIKWMGPPYARHEYNQFRRAAGIGPAHRPYRRALLRMLGRPCLALNVRAEMLLTPTWFAEPLDTSRIRCVGFPFLEDSATAVARDVERRIEAFIGSYGSPVVFTPGTGVADMEEFCRPIESACRRLGVPGILLARHGAATFEKMQRVLNHPILHVAYAPLAWLLPKAKLLVHTGGIGTIAEAVRAGVPQIVQPVFNDQPRNALRVLMNGLGGVLQGDAYSSTGIAQLYGELTASQLHLDCLDHYAAAVRAEDGAGIAALFLDELSRTGTSVPRAIAPEVPNASDLELTSVPRL